MSLPQLYVTHIIALLQKHFILLFLSYKFRQQKNRRKILLFFFHLTHTTSFPFINQGFLQAGQSKFSLMGRLKLQTLEY